jgi:hypothetical protein
METRSEQRRRELSERRQRATKLISRKWEEGQTSPRGDAVNCFPPPLGCASSSLSRDFPFPFPFPPEPSCAVPCSLHGFAKAPPRLTLVASWLCVRVCVCACGHARRDVCVRACVRVQCVVQLEGTGPKRQYVAAVIGW